MNQLWAAMILGGIIFAFFRNTLPEVTNSLFTSAKEAISLCITMAGILSFWSGLMEIAERSGMIRKLSRHMYPCIHFLFPGLPREHPAILPIAENIIANILGLGWAATPAGLRAMEALGQTHRQHCKKYGGFPQTATDEMCTFLILNTSSLQLIPIHIIAYRLQYHSTQPAAIIAPAILSTAISTLTAILFCKIMARKKPHC